MVITLGSVFIGLVVGLLAALAVARFDFRGRKPFIVAILVVQMVPLLTILVGLLPLLNATNLYGSVLGVILAYLVFTIPFIVWTLRTYIVGIPVELDEAAMVDGCTKAQAFRRVVLPLLAPGLVSTGVFAWIQAWNEFVMAREILAPAQNKTAMVWLTFFSDTPTHGSDYSGQMAGALIIAAPGHHLVHSLPKPPVDRSHRRRGEGVAGHGARMGEQLLRDAAAVLQPGFVNDDSGRVPDWVRRALTEDGLGGVAYYGRNIAPTPERTGELSAALRAENPHVLVAVDEEGGDVTRLDVATGSAFPGNYALGHVDDAELTETVARQIGRSLWRAGINLNYAPDADLNTNPDNPVIGIRSFGSDRGRGGAALRRVRQGTAGGRRGRLRQALPRARRHRRGLAPRPAAGAALRRGVGASTWRRSGPRSRPG